uniref:Uncharacterized protein n=1 Tax=Schistosoma haematobium TaxID=6185 RepID=A0A094ZGX6_SCHHA
MYSNSRAVKSLLKERAKQAPTGIPKDCGPYCRYYYNFVGSGQGGKMYVYQRTQSYNPKHLSATRATASDTSVPQITD